MDWTSFLTFALIALLFFLMMRHGGGCCGGANSRSEERKHIPEDRRLPRVDPNSK